MYKKGQVRNHILHVHNSITGTAQPSKANTNWGRCGSKDDAVALLSFMRLPAGTGFFCGNRGTSTLKNEVGFASIEVAGG